MPRDSGKDILSYTGEADLGIGMGQPVVAKDQTNPEVNKVMENLMLYDHQNQLTLYQQKIKDRDQLVQLMLDDQVSAGAMLDEDKNNHFNPLKDEVDIAYKAIKNGDDIQGKKKYHDLALRLADVAQWGQLKAVMIADQQKELSETTNSEERLKRQEWINLQLAKKPGEPIQPFVPLASYDHGGMNNAILGRQSTATTTTTTRTNNGKVVETNKIVPVTVQLPNGTSHAEAGSTRKPKTQIVPGQKPAATPIGGDGTVDVGEGEGGGNVIQTLPAVAPPGQILTSYGGQYNYDAVERNAADLYYNDKNQTQNMNRFFEVFHNMPPAAQKFQLDADNARLREYAKAVGIAPMLVPDPNDKSMIGPKNMIPGPYSVEYQYTTGPNGEIVVTDPVATFAAKHALASVSGPYKWSPTYAWDDKYANWKTKDALDKSIAYKNYQTGKLAYQKALSMQTAAEQTNQLDDIFTRSAYGQPHLIAGMGGHRIAFEHIQVGNSLPIAGLVTGKDGLVHPGIIRGIGAKPIYDKYEDGKPAMGSKVVGWEGGHYIPHYSLNGKYLEGKQIVAEYEKFKANQPDWGGSFDDYLKAAIVPNPVTGKPTFELALQGANGTTDRLVAQASIRALANAWQKKYQDAPFDLEAAENDPEIVSQASKETMSASGSAKQFIPQQ